MDLRRSPTLRLLAGLAVTLTAVVFYSAYTVTQLRALEQLQTTTIDRNRVDSLLLLRIQNNLNSIALTLRDMLDSGEPYPLEAWQAPLRRIRADLADAMEREAGYSPSDRTSDQRTYLSSRVGQFWDAFDRVFALAAGGDEKKARDMVRLSLEARQQALSTAVSRLLVQNNEREQEAAARTRAIYAGVRRNVYIFLAAALVLVLLTSLYMLDYNRRMFLRVADVSRRRSELAQQLISMQENIFRSVSRELHDEFGQILTAIGAMLQRAERRPPPRVEDLREVQEIVQGTLDKVRLLSHALHPVVLDDVGFESAVDAYLPGFEKQTGIKIQYDKAGPARELDRGIAIHLYRVLQEALNNVARHSKCDAASVRLQFLPKSVVLEVEDRGVGFANREKQGLGLVSMQERAELVNGRLEFGNREGGGALVRITIPTAERAGLS